MRAWIPVAACLPLACAAPGGGTGDPRVARVEAFVAARERGDDPSARDLLGPDPRIWYDARKGEGAPWKLGGGRWKAWDDHFRSSPEFISDWHVEEDPAGGAAVWADRLETNDYFRLTGSQGGVWRGTYFLDAEGRIVGFLISAVPGAVADRGRRDEFQDWAREHHPDEAEYLMPGGRIDPTGDRPRRMRALLDTWRAEVGLPAIP